MVDLNPDQFPDDHEVYYHMTDKAKFKPSAKHVPEDNALALHERTSPGMYLTKSPESWVNGHGYVRPFVAEVHVPRGVGHAERYNGEHFVPAADLAKVKVNRVIPLDAHARETFGEPGWVEEHHGSTFDTGAPITPHGHPGTTKFPDYHYDGPDVRDMSSDVVRQHKQRVRQYLKDR